MARIVFDLDGTLIDSAPDIRLAANRALAGCGAAPLSLAETRSFVGAGAPAFVARMARARGLPETCLPELLARFLDGYEAAVHLTEVYAGAREALAALGAEGHALGLCTNKPEAPARAVLAHLGLDARFAVVIGGDTLAVRKPDPAPLVVALEALGTGPAAYVGDSEVDAETALRAGVPFLLFTRGYRHAPVEDLPHAGRFDDWAAMPGLVAEVLGRPPSALPEGLAWGRASAASGGSI